MSHKEIRSEEMLDRAIEAVKQDQATPETERQAAQRAWERISRQVGESVPAPEAVDRLRETTDFEEMIPAYLDDRLPEARRMLFKDELSRNVRLRRALKAERSARAESARRPTASRRSTRRLPAYLPKALAATLVAALAAAGLYLGFDLLTGPSTLGRVATIDGQLYHLEDGWAKPVVAGDEILEDQSLRTSHAGGAVLELEDGSRVEVRERSEILFAEAFDGTTVRVARGGVIVEAAPQARGHLYVATEDCRVSVKGTVFSVNHGTKGSRVSVLEGEVHVASGEHNAVLRPGDQLATRQNVGTVPLAAEVSWSRDPERYAALLEEAQLLQEAVQQVFANTTLRYDHRLLDLVPPATTFYAAVPNLTDELDDLHAVLEDRLADSPELRAWFESRFGSDGFSAQLGPIASRISGLGEHLGEEVVFAARAAEDDESVLLLAEIANPPVFAAILADEVDRINGMGDGPTLRIITDPATAAPADDELLLWVAGDVFAASPALDSLVELATHLADPASNPFVGSDFHTQLAEAYGQGAEWLAGVDLAGLIGAQIDGLDDSEGQALAFTGLDGVDHLIVERKSRDETVHTGAVLSFDGPRQGAAAWLAAPAPMGALEYISAEAHFATGFVVEDPAVILEQTFDFLETTDPEFRAELERIQSELGIDIIADLAAPLGGEAAFALDGPTLPLPAWKVVFEVYDAPALENALRWAIDQIANSGEPATPPTLNCEDLSGRRYCTLTGGATFELVFAIDGGYLVAAPSRALVDSAFEVRDSRYSLVDAPVFRDLLPADGYLDFSAAVFTNLGVLSEALLGAAGAAGLSPEQTAAFRQLDLAAPTLTCAYGDSEAIRVVSTARGGLLAGRLGGMLGMTALGEPGFLP